MNIVYVYADNPREWNCSEWRCAVPARAIQRTGRHRADLIYIDDFARKTPAAEALCRAADIIVVQRNLFGPVLAAIQHWKARDKVVIAEFDDAYDLMPPTNAAFPFWGKGLIQRPGEATLKLDPPPLTQFRWGLGLVHAATLPSKRLADDWRSFTETIYLPNYIDLEKYANAIPEAHEGVVIGWGGSLSHLQSFTGSGVLPALKRVCRARPQVKVMIAGNDRRILEQLGLPENQSLYQPWTPYSEWPRVLVKLDIGIAPLSGAYDDRRSWIKPLEYLVMKIPWAASDSPAYHDLRAYGWLVKNTPNAWERVLLDMVDHLPDYRQEAAGSPYLFGVSQGVEENVERILATYAGIIQRVNSPIAEASAGSPVSEPLSAHGD